VLLPYKPNQRLHPTYLTAQDRGQHTHYITLHTYIQGTRGGKEGKGRKEKGEEEEEKKKKGGIQSSAMIDVDAS